MADKAHEEVEAKMSVSDAEGIDDAVLPSSIDDEVPQDGMLEQGVAEADGSENEDSGIGGYREELIEDTRKSQETEVQESVSKVPLTKTEVEMKKTKNSSERKRFKIQLFISIVQAAAAIATVLTAVLAWGTLNEMKTERNNAYRPEIVVAPNVFEGYMYNKIDYEKGKEYIAFEYKESDSKESFETPPVPDPNRTILLEWPYLTLKNIGKGTAKDVSVTFSTEWVGKVIDWLNSDSINDYTYELLINDSSDTPYGLIRYSSPGEFEDAYLGCVEFDIDNVAYIFEFTNNQRYSRNALHIGRETKNVTYIASDEDSVKVRLPVAWCGLLAAVYQQGFRVGGTDNRIFNHETDIFPAKLPNLVIKIQYSDMQGAMYTQEETIPWTVQYRFLEYSESKEADVESIYLRTGFYEDYIR